MNPQTPCESRLPTIPTRQDRSAYASGFSGGLSLHLSWTVRRYQTLAGLALALELDRRDDEGWFLIEDFENHWNYKGNERMEREHDEGAGYELARLYVANLCDSGVTRDHLVAILRSEIAARGRVP